jgi:hypothetical protein
VLALFGCSKLTDGPGGVVALELRVPSPAAVEANDTLTLRARALDANGDSLGTPVYWRTLDDSVLTIVDSLGVVTTSRTSGTARVQAHVGSLRSELVILTLRPHSDTLRLTVPDSIVVASGDTAPDTLGAAVETLNPAGGVSGTSILYEVVDTTAARGTVALSNGRLAYRATTGVSGSPAAAVVIRKLAGATPPASVQVRVSATRPSGQAVPGTGQLFTLLYQ